MSVIDDALSAILKGANPSASDEDIAAQVAGLKQSGGEAVNQALSFIPGLKDMKDIASNAPALANNPVVQGMANGATGAPLAPNVPNPGNPISGIAQGAVSGTVAPSQDNLPETMNVPDLPDVSKNFQWKNGLSPQPTPSASASTPSPAPSAPAPQPEDNSTPVADAVMSPSSNDVDARAKANADAMSKRKLAGIPAAVAGIGDAIASGASAFGVKAPTDVQDKLLDRAKANFEESKTLFDEKLKNDPNSDISKSYRAMVTQIAPALTNNPNFTSMSAQAIGDKLPLIDTVMKAQANKDARELGLKQTQANKEIALGERKDQFEDRAVNQGLARIASIRGDASLARSELQRDAAITAVNRINEVHAAGKELNPVDYADILGQTYKARSGNAPDQEIMKQIRQPVGSATFNRAWTYLTGQQAPATSKDISNSLLNIASSMGKQADAFHDSYMAPHLVKPAGVSDEKWAPIVKVGRGMSFADGTKQKQGTSSSNDPLGLGL